MATEIDIVTFTNVATHSNTVPKSHSCCYLKVGNPAYNRTVSA